LFPIAMSTPVCKCQNATLRGNRKVSTRKNCEKSDVSFQGGS
jgi:hypothetical protein